MPFATPLSTLSAILAKLHDDQGRVTIPRFYDSVEEPSAQERAAAAAQMASAPVIPGGADRHGEHGYSDVERIWYRPTAEINAVWGGQADSGFATSIPAVAHARLSFRLVPQQEPQIITAAVTQWLAAQIPPGVSATITPRIGALAPYALKSLDHPALTCVLMALERVFGHQARCVREGGSGPDATLAAKVGAPVVCFGVALPEDG